jgi:hypothetical protein
MITRHHLLTEYKTRHHLPHLQRCSLASQIIPVTSLALTVLVV